MNARVPVSVGWSGARRQPWAGHAKTLAVLVAGTAWAAQSSPNTLTGGGGLSVAGNATVGATIGDWAGVAATSSGGNVVLKPGFIGQLREVTGITLTANPDIVAGGGTTQLSGLAMLDDDTVLVLAGRDVAWATPIWPLDVITGEGLASAAVVETFVPAPFTGTYLGVVGQGSVQVVARPWVTTMPASGVISLGNTYRAQLDGLINPRGFPTTAWFEWGAQTGSVQWATQPTLIAGTNAVPVSAPLENLPVAEAYQFRVVASNPVIGTVRGESRTFGAPPLIIEQPIEWPWPIEAGTPFDLAVEATGTAWLRYQWLKDGLDLASAVDPRLLFPQAQPTDSGEYSVVIANDWGAVTSRVVRLTVMAAPIAPEILAQPANQVVTVGGTLDLSAEARGDAPLTFQWRKNTVNLCDGPNDDPLERPLLTNGVVSGATTPHLVITNFQPADAGTYSLVVQNSLGVAESAAVRVRLAGVPELDLADGDPAGSPLLAQPAGVVSARTDGFQSRAGVPCLGGAQATMGWLHWLSPADGVATFTTAGSGYDTALAVYDQPPDTHSPPVGCDDDGAGYLTSYHAFRARAGSTYWLVVAGAQGAHGSVVLTWTLDALSLPPPAILAQPLGKVTETGQPGELVVVLTNLVPGDLLQWRRNGTNLMDSPNVVGATTTVSGDAPGAFTNTLILHNVSTDDVGVYSLLVSRSGLGSVETAPVFLELREGAASKDITSEYKRDVLLERIMASRRSGLGASRGRRGAGPAPSAGTIMSDNFRPPGQGGTPQTLVIGGHALWCYVPIATDGFLTIETANTGFDPVLQLWASSDERTCLLEGEDDNGAADGINAQVWLFARTNKIYLAVVDGHGGASGPLSLKWTLEPEPQPDSFRWYALNPSEYVPPGYAVVDTTPATKIGKVLVCFGRFPDLGPVRTFSGGTPESPHVWFSIATSEQYLVAARPIFGASPKEMQFRSSFRPAPPPEVSLHGQEVTIRWLHSGLKLQTAERVQGPWFDDIHSLTDNGSANELRFIPDGNMRLFRVVPE